MTKLSDEWQTPSWLFEELNAEFGFTIDLAANASNTKCEKYTTDYLSEALDSDVVGWLNPPYSNPRPFIEKAYNDAKEHGITIVCLVKCDPSTKWWATFWNYDEDICGHCSLYIRDFSCPRCKGEQILSAGPKPRCEVRFLPKRVKFEHPTLKSSSPTFPSAIVIFRGDQM